MPPTDLPEGFKGTGKPIRSSEIPRPNAEEHPGEHTDGPLWFQILVLLVFVVGLYFVGGWVVEAVKALAHLTF